MASGILKGRRIVITRMRQQAQELEELLKKDGAEPVICPAIEISPPEHYGPLDDAIDQLEKFDLIVFTSANSVDALASRMATRGVRIASSLPPVAAVGQATSRVAVAHGFNVEIVPQKFLAESLVDDLRSRQPGRVLVLRGDLGRRVVRDGLGEAGWDVVTVVAYRTVPGDGITELDHVLKTGTVDAVLFSSSSSVRYCLEGLKQAGNASLLIPGPGRPAIICLGPVTAYTAREMGLTVDAVAEHFDTRGLVEAVIGWFTTNAFDD